MKKILQLLAMLLCVAFSANAQTKSVSGTVTDGSGAALPGVSVVVKGTTTGAITDIDGKFNIKAPAAATTVTLSFVGFKTIDAAIPASGIVDVVLASSDNELEAVVVTTGSRNSKRVLTDTPLPIDILSSKDLASTGQMRMDQALQYRVPSFNTVNTPVNDATTLLDPYEIRNMGPSRTLILINGKRKNLSSLLYVQFSPGRGETGVDVSAIPMEAVKRVEILRDGASAQYGSDAIAGVMNFILKDKYDFTTLNVNAGITAQGDGATYGVSLNSGGNIGAKGFVNYTLGFNQQDNAIRSGTIHVPTEIATFGNPYGNYKNDNGSPNLEKFQKEGGIRYDGTPINAKGASATLADVNAWNNSTAAADNNAKYNTIITNYLNDYPTGGNLNGTGEITSAKFLINAGTSFGETGMLYANAAIVSKRVLSNANFRTPYWRQDRGLLGRTGTKNYIQSPSQLAFGSDGIDLYKGYIGYMPSFEGDLVDYNATIGATNEVNGWKSDLSLTTGGNTQRYTVDNTVNRGLGKSSPTRFKPGGFGFSHLVGNLDVSKAITEQFSMAFGAEARSETYTIVAGDTASYKAEGSNSFPGIDAINAGSNSRFNLGVYLDASYDVSKDFLINGTVRAEKYSDFGTATVGKISTRYKLADDKVTIRGSFSTGFRAPSLHQIYSQSVQASFAGGTIVSSGLFNNRSSEARALDIPTLKPEKSTNISLGVGLNPTKNLSVTLDYYSINVKDRIVYSSSISSDDKTSALYKILQGGGLRSVQFFINGIETNTAGLDFIVSQKNLMVGMGKLAINLAGNYMVKNEIVGTPTEPAAIKAAGSSILNEQIKSLLTESRPKYKVILGFDYNLGKFVFNLNNTLFGPTAFRDYDNGGGAMADIKAVFKPAVVTDLSIAYRFTEKVAFSLNINNLLNVVPKWDLEASSAPSNKDAAASAARAAKILNDPAEKALLRGFLGFSGRYDILGYNGSQFSQLGTVLNANLNIKF
jgi:iron complex outermembrane recepter protein